MFASLQAWNQSVFLALNGLVGNPIIRDIAIIFSDAPIFFLPLFLVVGWLYYRKNTAEKTQLLGIFYATLVSIVMNMIIQHLVYVERPITFLGAKAHFVLSHIPDASFPSDHAAVGFAFLTSLSLFGFRKVFWWFLPFCVIMVISRIVAGVHWPLDVLAGITVGIVSAYIVYSLRNRSVFKRFNTGLLNLLARVHL